MEEKKKIDLIELNEEQAHFYNTPKTERKYNAVMKMWLVVRRRMYHLMNNSKVWDDVYALQKEWMGDLSNKKVLDFGCYEGNALSFYLAENAASYLGIDLSKRALQSLGENFEKLGIKNARLQCVDVLSSDFRESDFNIVYAQGVLHHFNPIDVLLPVLHKKLVPKGKIVSLDPLQTSFLTKSVRLVYHPFRSDKKWEWPFTTNTFASIKKYFNPVGIQGVMGYSKWAIPIAFLHKEIAVKVFRKLHSKDMALSKNENRHLWRCMQVAMCLEKRADSD